MFQLKPSLRRRLTGVRFRQNHINMLDTIWKHRLWRTSYPPCDGVAEAGDQHDNELGQTSYMDEDSSSMSDQEECEDDDDEIDADASEDFEDFDEEELEAEMDPTNPDTAGAELDELSSFNYASTT